MWKRLKGTIRKNLFSIISIALSAVLLLIFFFATDGVNNLANIMTMLRPGWLIAAFACMAAYWLLEAWTLHIFVLKTQKPWRFRDSFATASTGLLYSALTPSSTGGQPMAIIRMRKQGLDTGKATSAVILKTFIYQLVLVFACLGLIIQQLGFFQANVSNFSFIVVLGFILNAAFILLLLLFTLNRTLTRAILNAIIRLLAKMRIVKEPEKTVDAVAGQLELFHQHTRPNKGTVIVLGKTFVTTLAQLFFYFAIPYCIYRSFGLVGARLVSMIAAQAFVMMVSTFIPLPGASGGAEGSFLIFFGLFFPSGTIVSAILLWRLISYYSIILLGCFLMNIGSHKKKAAPGAPEAEAPEAEAPEAEAPEETQGE